MTYVRENDDAAARKSIAVDWPSLLVYSRLDPVELAASDPREEPPWRADLRSLPDVSYRARPNFIVFLLLAGATAALIAALVVLAPLALPALRRLTRRKELAWARLPSFERALALLDRDTPGAVEPRRQALELVATELGQHGESELELSARRLAWSEEPPALADTKTLVEDVRQRIAGRKNGRRR